MKISRRTGLMAGGAATAFSMIPGKVLGANEKVNVAWIGVGGRGNRLLSNFERSGIMNVVAMCDVDLESNFVAEAKGRFPNAYLYDDWRKLFDEKANEFDAVMVMVPDHSHFPITMAAMALGKHVYTEKPLARTFQEIELMTKAAERHGVVNQMGNQGFSGDNYFQFKAWKEAGIIKNVRHVDAFINNGFAWYPHHYNKNKAIHEWPVGDPMPENINWDVWMGTTPEHPYSTLYSRNKWRGWQQYGTGAFGDWGAHIFDTMHHFLEFGMPESIEVKKLKGKHELIFCEASTLGFKFPERNGLPAMTVDYYDGWKNMPPVPEEFHGREHTYNTDPGKFIFTDDLTFFGKHHGHPLQVIPYEKYRELLKAGKLPKNWGKNSDHYANFLLACKGEEKTRSPFSIAGPLSQFLILGSIAQRIGNQGETLEFDRAINRFKNNDLANSLLKDSPRKGWEQYYNL
ncbi:Gfo/Idh/MocA family oxidoreductase [Pontiellaceae bacterium B12227]|nr:Gfo/Idh/MocA family oxidoreductase [Pontiellaceae bacterium B12227]